MSEEETTTAYEDKLLSTIGKLQVELDEARSWNATISQLLLHRETQVQNIIAALGEDAIPEHAGKAKFREYMNAMLDGEQDG